MLAPTCLNQLLIGMNCVPAFATMKEIEAKCPNCTKRAIADEDLTKVICRECGFTASYEDYLEIMKSKAVLMADDFQLNWDKG
jgi:ribosomal protein L37AE/L43A